MSERLALMQLHNALRGDSDSARQAWRTGVAFLGFNDLLLKEDSGFRPEGPAGSDESFTSALGELSKMPDPSHKPLPDEVAPIEKLDLLIRLSKSKVSLTPEQKLAVEAVATTLIDPEAADKSAQAMLLLNAIDQIPGNQQVIRIPDLEPGKQVPRSTRPRAPRAGSGGTVRDVLAVPGGLRLAKGLIDHPVVDVDACIYKAMVGSEAEYPVHLRTTISVEKANLQIDDFDPLFEPKEWPTYNSFWAAMDEITAKVPPVGGAAGAAGALTTEEEVISTADPYVEHVEGIGWESIGTFHEQVGFDNGLNGKGAKPDLYPDTYLYFSRCKSAPEWAVLTYTLLRRPGAPLGVDDGCIEIKPTGSRVDVITTKSLYVSGMGRDTELAGILAYLAAYCGWGANTLLLVSNAVLSK